MRDEAQRQALALQLFQSGAITKQKLFSMIGLPDAQEELERVGEGMLDQALQVLMQAGLPGEMAQYLKENLSQYQGGSGMSPKRTAANVPQQGVARQAQGLPPVP